MTSTENIAAKPPIIRLSDVHLTLTSRAGPVDILRGVSLDIPAGQSVAIVGPSGSGKTSLLMIMAGLERVTRGKVAVAGRDFVSMNEDQLALARAARKLGSCSSRFTWFRP